MWVRNDKGGWFMIAKQNLKEMLAALEFEERTEDLWVKQ